VGLGYSHTDAVEVFQGFELLAQIKKGFQGVVLLVREIILGVVQLFVFDPGKYS
jgi:hypothetical protein